MWALGLFTYAGITDLVDGYIARRWRLQTVIGTVIDPMADKTLMTVLTVCLAVKGALPAPNSSGRVIRNDSHAVSFPILPSSVSPSSFEIDLCCVPFTQALTMKFRRYLVACTTVWSGASYVYSKDAVKILSARERAEKAKPKD
ncbi:MAG: hypothetical protein M1833_005972 [Piccolia ochrophora]|nr:MAG: hypothetical protein M1833_005972 [Piccolia ochrophora]